MTRQEFTQRTGYTPATEEEYTAIEMMYLEAGESVDKDLFCKEWLKHKDSNLLRIFYRRAMENKEKLNYYDEMRAKTAQLLIRKAAEFDDITMYNEAVKLIGQKRVVLFKIKEGIELNAADLEYITDNLQ